MFDSSLNANVTDPSMSGRFAPQGGPQFSGGNMPRPQLQMGGGQNSSLLQLMQLLGRGRGGNQWGGGQQYIPESGDVGAGDPYLWGSVKNSPVSFLGNKSGDGQSIWRALVNTYQPGQGQDTAGAQAFKAYQKPENQLRYGNTGPAMTTNTWGQDLQDQRQQDYEDNMHSARVKQAYGDWGW